MADREEILKALESQREKFFNKKIASAFRNWSKTMQYYFPDIDEYFVIPLKNGKPGPIIEGKVNDAGVYYEMTTDTFLAISRKEISGMKAYTQKKVMVKASIPDLIRLKKLDSI